VVLYALISYYSSRTRSSDGIRCKQDEVLRENKRKYEASKEVTGLKRSAGSDSTRVLNEDELEEGELPPSPVKHSTTEGQHDPWGGEPGGSRFQVSALSVTPPRGDSGEKHVDRDTKPSVQNR